MIVVAVLGYGTVGSGVVELLDVNREKLAKRAGEDVVLKYILDVRDFEDSPYKELFVKDFSVIENDPEVNVVVETIGGVKIAQDFTRRALNASKSVVTSNKELVSEYGCELLELAREKGVCYLFEASVGGGIPILHPINFCYSGENIEEIYGIVNGTTNYILTNMVKHNARFEDALAEAQAMGYAERDPSADINGIDTCRKTCILADLAFGKNITPGCIKADGIVDINSVDVACADKIGASIKLIGRTLRTAEGKIAAYTAPHVLLSDNLLSKVDGVFNGVVVRADATGETMYYGRGAGKLPTAAAVVSDIADTVKIIKSGRFLGWEPAGEEIIADTDSLENRWYIRANLDIDETAVKFGDVTIISSDENGTAFLTACMSAYRCSELIEGIDAVSVYRVLE